MPHSYNGDARLVDSLPSWTSHLPRQVEVGLARGGVPDERIGHGVHQRDTFHRSFPLCVQGLLRPSERDLELAENVRQRSGVAQSAHESDDVAVAAEGGLVDRQIEGVGHRAASDRQLGVEGAVVGEHAQVIGQARGPQAKGTMDQNDVHVLGPVVRNPARLQADRELANGTVRENPDTRWVAFTRVAIRVEERRQLAGKVWKRRDFGRHRTERSRTVYVSVEFGGTPSRLGLSPKPFSGGTVNVFSSPGIIPVIPSRSPTMTPWRSMDEQSP